MSAPRYCKCATVFAVCLVVVLNFEETDYGSLHGIQTKIFDKISFLRNGTDVLGFRRNIIYRNTSLGKTTKLEIRAIEARTFSVVIPTTWVPGSYFGRIFWTKREFQCGNNILNIKYARDRELIAQTDIIIFELTHIDKEYKAYRKAMLPHPENQTIFALGVESVQHYPFVWPYSAVKAKYPLVNLFASPRPDADVQFNIFGPEYGISLPYGLLRKPEVPFSKLDKRALLQYSNCRPKSDRNVIIKNIIRLAPDLIDNRGKCFGGHQAGTAYSLSGIETKISLLKNHMFAFALENCEKEPGYVSEKIFQAWQYGSIPIARHSAPEMMDFYVPCKKCALFIEDFNSVAALVEEMRRIVKNRSLHQEYMEWKSAPNMSMLHHLAYQSSRSLPCRLLNKSLEFQRMKNRYIPPWQLERGF